MSDDAPAPDRRADEEELRLAVVMNGGVSLAVWMGGVTRELDRVRRGEGPYGALAGLTRSVPRIDVIAGSSAGGINGALLAVAIAHGARVDVIRDLWMRDGSIVDLLRDPLQRDAPSLFRGDKRLLARLALAVEAVAKHGGGPPDDPLHLTITGTMLQGEVKAYADHFGAVIPDVDHRARFQFRRGRVGEVPEGDEAADELRWPSDFEGPVALAQVALAARSSASFPVAFEPSFCPVGLDPEDGEGVDAAHPSMRGVANFSQSRWVIDGGVLVNTPFRPALDAIATLPAEGAVRRVLAYVVPHPTATAAAADEPQAVPSALAVAMDAGSRLPRGQSIGRELEEISANNRRVRKRRGARACTLEDLDSDALEDAARVLLHSYRCVRREAAAADIVDLLLAGWRERERETWRHQGSDLGRPRPIELWRREPSITDVESVRASLLAVDAAWLPPEPDRTQPWRELPLDPWRWGLAPVEHAGNVVLDVLRTAIGLSDLGERRRGIQALRRELHERLAELRRAERHNEDYWRGQAHVLSDPSALGDAIAGWSPVAAEAYPIALGLARILNVAWDELALDAPGVGAHEGLREQLLTLVAGNDGGQSGPELTLRRLLALDVVQRSSGAELSGIDQEIELVLMSADADNSFDARGRAEQKLAGLQVGHFGSFYKRSWRANDWMWGRLDGADRLVRTMLDPRRIRRRLDEPGATPMAIRDEIRQIAAPAEAAQSGPSLDGAALAWLAGKWGEHEDAILTELEELPDKPHSADLPCCHEAVRRRVQLEILGDEIADVRRAAKADLDLQTSPSANGASWQAGLPDGQLTGPAAIEAFLSCDIGTEAIADEVGSDFFTNVATKTLGVAGSVAGSAVKWKPLQPVLSTIRGIVLALYLVARGVVTGSATGNFLVALVLALGGALVALFLIGVSVPGLLALLGAAMLIVGVLLGLIRGTTPRIAFVLGTYVVAVAAYYGVREWTDRPSWVEPIAGMTAVVLLALAATALGYHGGKPEEAGS